MACRVHYELLEYWKMCHALRFYEPDAGKRYFRAKKQMPDHPLMAKAIRNIQL